MRFGKLVCFVRESSYHSEDQLLTRPPYLVSNVQLFNTVWIRLMHKWNHISPFISKTPLHLLLFSSYSICVSSGSVHNTHFPSAELTSALSFLLLILPTWTVWYSYIRGYSQFTIRSCIFGAYQILPLPPPKVFTKVTFCHIRFPSLPFKVHNI